MNIQEICERIREIDISQIIKTRISLVRNGNSYVAICPFHNDTSLGSFVVTPSKGIFKCFSCGAGGDAIKFISLYDSINYYEAAVRIAVNIKLINKSDGEKLLNRKISKEEVYSLEKIYTDLDKTQKKSLNLDKVNLIYHYFKQGNKLLGQENSKLSKEHYEYLKGRGITDEDIEKSEYFTMPSTKIMPILNTVAKLCNTDFSGVPGFYYNKNTDKVEFYSIKGIGIPIKNTIGKIVGIQVRKDTVTKGPRYVWFSSTFASQDGNDKTKTGGSSPGAPLDIILPEKIEAYQDTSDYECSKTLFITEGHFKGTKITQKYNAVSISVQGVGNWNGIHNALSDISYRYKNRIKNIYIAFDADMVYNIQVFKQAIKMYLYLKKIFKDTYKFYFVIWDVSLGKGIDDVIDNGNNTQIQKQIANDFIDNYIKFIKSMLVNEKIVKNEDLKDFNMYTLFDNKSSKLNDWLKQVNDKDMEKYFNKIVLKKDD